MAWFKKSKAPIAPVEAKKVQMPEGLWTKCKNCNEIIYTKEIERNLKVCPKCDYHFRISARERIALVLDDGSFVETDAEMTSVDFLKFKDSKKYSDRIKASLKKSGGGDAVVTGSGTIEGLPAVVAVFDFSFMGGSMGSVVGEKITRAIELGLEMRAPVLVFSSSGGARMQESILSLMQMAKSSAALAKLKQAGLPFISVLTDPEHGMVDMIVPRQEMKQRLAQILQIFMHSPGSDDTPEPEVDPVPKSDALPVTDPAPDAD
jgi:acetyl-CoA carboxylase carboxyl transferase subunit beta